MCSSDLSAYSQRIAQEEVVLGNATLPKGSIVIFSQFMTHRTEKIYIEPSRFMPERWLTIKPSPYEYLPFGGGSRLCLGSTLALSIMRGVLPTIWRRFRMSAIPNSEVSALVVSTMVGPTTAVPMQLHQPGSRIDVAPLRGNISELVTFDTERRAIRRAA